jgi:hypothetical protein
MIRRARRPRPRKRKLSHPAPVRYERCSGSPCTGSGGGRRRSRS